MTSLAYACGTPDLVFAPAADAATEAAVIDDASSDAGTANPDAPGDEIEASTRADAAKIAEGGACIGANPCDCDNDGHLAMRPECPNGDDCDDFDGLRHPNQGYVAEPPDEGKDGNWDCSSDGTVEKQYNYSLVCGLLGGSGVGFITNPGCGETATYFRCTGLLGGFIDAGVRRQGCR